MVHPDAASSSFEKVADNRGQITDPAEDWPTLDVLRLRYIHRVIAHTGNNKTRAAELLGIDRRTLNRILARERLRTRAAAAATAH